MFSLAEYFHNVTVVSPYPVKKPLHFYDEVSLESNLYDAEFYAAEIPSILNIEQIPFISSLRYFYESGEDTVNYVLTHPNMIELMKSGKKFDACIIENSHFEALMGLAEIFECVLITYTTYPSVHLIDRMTGNISPTSFVPNSLLEYTDTMNFKERFFNTLNTLMEKIFYEFYHLPNQKRLYEKFFPNAHHSFYDVYKNSSIIFINNNVVISSPRPYLPNMIDIGGIHVSQPKPLKKKLQKFLDTANDGVIIFSMGSLLQGSDWDDVQREAFIEAFRELKQKVLWKYENETLPNKPSNVKISKWLPQSDVLAHENVKLFITHAGLLGSTEALIHSVPMLAIPMFGDQHMNAANAVVRGYGLQLDYKNLTKDKISDAINEMLSNEKYQINAKLWSSRFKDRPITPKLSVIYWTKYAVKHKGAFHLRTTGNELSFIELYSLDVLISMFAIFFTIIFVCCKIFIKIFKPFSSRNQKVKQQ
ncbi:hypothetical protein PVAND_002723 [Polypedilum vanderplanki]|uniref:UDP-glucuronosyltransferase n=1 Tax=Polypedilum vanderplanki TaxID=319348 RepID=A0A9J6BSC5_POLVA|nr:hypothetical protein PVAND_002723 [Polypedilum vanderplanki]